MGDPIWLAVLGAAVVAFVLLRRAGLARTARERLTADTDLPAPSQPPARATSSVGVRGLAVGLGLAVAAALALATPTSPRPRLSTAMPKSAFAPSLFQQSCNDAPPRPGGERVGGGVSERVDE